MKRFCFLLALAFAVNNCGDHEDDKQPTRKQTQNPAPNDDRGLLADCDKVLDPKAAVQSLDKSVLATLKWTDPLKQKKFLRAKLVVADSAGCTPESAEIMSFEPTMPSHGGHGTFTEKQKVTADPKASPYKFDVEGVYFVMGGPWLITVTAKVDGIERVIKFDAKVD